MCALSVCWNLQLAWKRYPRRWILLQFSPNSRIRHSEIRMLLDFLNYRAISLSLKNIFTSCCEIRKLSWMKLSLILREVIGYTRCILFQEYARSSCRSLSRCFYINEVWFSWSLKFSGLEQWEMMFETTKRLVD